MRHPVDFDISKYKNKQITEIRKNWNAQVPILIQILQERDAPFVVMRGRDNVFCKVFNKALTWQSL